MLKGSCWQILQDSGETLQDIGITANNMCHLPATEGSPPICMVGFLALVHHYFNVLTLLLFDYLSILADLFAKSNNLPEYSQPSRVRIALGAPPLKTQTC